VLAEHVAQQAASPAPTVRAWQRPPRRAYRAALVATLSLAGALTLLLIGSDLAYRERVLPGVSVGQIAVGNQPVLTVEQELRAQQQRIAQRIVQVEAGERVWRVPLSALVPDQAAEMTRLVHAYGHEPAFWQRAMTRTRAVLGRQQAIAQPSVNNAAIRDVVAAMSAQISQPRHDAKIVSTAQGWTLVPEQTGVSIDRDAAVAQLEQLVRAQAWQQQSAPLRLQIPIHQDAPLRTAAELEPALTELLKLQTQPLELSAGEQRWTLDRSLLVQLDTVKPVTLAPDPRALNRELDRLATALAVTPQPSYLEREGDRVRTMALGKAGRELDREAALQRITTALTAGAPSVELPLRELPPAPGEVEQLGLIAELGRGESQFLTYSSPERDANVQAGGNDIDGRLIAPGEVFSFNAAVGEITPEKGYRWGEAIEAGTVVPSLGGGICQVSTTTFRAAFWSGLEIIERHNHSWRLPWYEVDAPPGMDATIALGGPDLKFRNNTGHYLLIKVETDLVNKRQTAIIYGTPDGRNVQMAPLSDGNIGVQRRVLGDNGLALDDTFVSYYSQ
jgi:vancomycin resistance protein YoaR